MGVTLLLKRFTRILGLSGSAAIGLMCVGCSAGASVSYYDEDRPKQLTLVSFDAGHVCTGDCDHYFEEGRTYRVRHGHVHGPGCGHHFDGTRWILAVSTTAAPTIHEGHICTGDCSHDHDD